MSLLEPLPKDDEFSRLRRGMMFYTSPSPSSLLKPYAPRVQGEVYKAKDTRLDRTVAIKVLPEHLAKDPERRERFEREARAVSSLNHPHICTLYEFDNQDGIDFIVMEYIEGETLADRLARGPLPLEQALQYGIQIADALDKAHCRGVVHRDLKPGNVMVTKPGIKLLDFGLAKFRQKSVASSEDSEEPTRQKPLTDAGAILGTVQYMAPEQLEGKEADARTDIFAFGHLLYEMVTGRKAFEGKSQASLISEIMSADPPPIATLQPMTPPALNRVVKQCLAKDPDERLQSAHDVALEVKWISEDGATGFTAIINTTGRSAWTNPMIGLASGGLIAAILFWILLPSPLERSVSRVLMSVRPAEELGDWGSGPPSGFARLLTLTAMAFSPDRALLAFVGRRNDVQQLYLRSIEQYDARPLPGTEGAVNPFFSPDGEWVGFWANGQLKKIPAAGASPVTLCAVPSRPHGATWTPDDKVIYAPLRNGLMEVSAAGGSPQALTTVDMERGEVSHRLPVMLPGGRAVLFTVTRFQLGGWDASTIEVLSLETGERKLLVDGGADARYVSTGHLVYIRLGSLMAVPFDIERVEVTGDPVTMIDGIMQAANGSQRGTDTGAAQFRISSSGTLAYVPGGIFPEARRRLVWVDRRGGIEPLEAPPRSYWSPRLSPDGNRIALHSYTNTIAQVWVYDVAPARSAC